MSFKTISVNDWLISDVKVGSTIPVFYTESINMKGNAQGTGLHRLLVDFTINFKNQQDLILWEGISTGLRINSSPFYLDLGTDSTWMNPLTNGSTSTITLTTKVPVGSSKMSVTNTSAVAVGNKFTFLGDTKVHIVTEKENNVISFYPAARVQSDITSVVNFRNPKPLLRLDQNEIKIDYSGGSKVMLSTKEVL